MSPNIPILLRRNWFMILVNLGYNEGPVNSVSLREYPVDVLANTSNTARNLVVVVDSLTTPCIGRWYDLTR